uniref:procollagen-proline 4-dioxygenase n=1 Tax=Macrostomum lignano TaxID=282301 RepID=A0A1I8I3T1_9PLAT
FANDPEDLNLTSPVNRHHRVILTFPLVYCLSLLSRSLILIELLLQSINMNLKCNLLLLVICVVSLWADHCSCELFTAVIDIQKSLQQEQDLAVALEDYVSQEMVRLSSVKRFAETLKSRVKTDDTNSTDLTHPVYAYLMLKRLGVDWQEHVKGKKEELKNSFESRIQNLSLPGIEDVDGAMDAIVRLQDTYALPARMLSTGKVSHEFNFSKSIMTADECFAIALFAYTKGDLYHAKDWFSVALGQMGDRTISSQGLKRSRILDYLAYVLYKQGHLQEALALTNELLVLEPGHERALNNRAHFERQLANELAAGGPRRKGDTGSAEDEEAIRHNAPHREGWYASAEFQRYKRLCRGQLLPGDFESVASNKPLVCRYHRPHAYFYLAPVKEEIAHWRPLIVLWHGIIGTAETATIRQLAEPRLRRATVQDPATGRLVTARYRISKSAWLQSVLHPAIENLDRRIELLTGLSVASAEELQGPPLVCTKQLNKSIYSESNLFLQVVNYGLGGHYEPHYDFAHRREVNSFERAQGNRIATLLYYLSDVPAGGATVFTDLGVRLLPTRGSAAFWFNLKRSGEGEMLTRHAACPVLHGSKWVMNKWFHERDQEFRRPCSLDSNE